jgi:hypothetical protein
MRLGWCYRDLGDLNLACSLLRRACELQGRVREARPEFIEATMVQCDYQLRLAGFEMERKLPEADVRALELLDDAERTLDSLAAAGKLEGYERGHDDLRTRIDDLRTALQAHQEPGSTDAGADSSYP